MDRGPKSCIGPLGPSAAIYGHQVDSWPPFKLPLLMQLFGSFTLKMHLFRSERVFESSTQFSSFFLAVAGLLRRGMPIHIHAKLCMQSCTYNVYTHIIHHKCIKKTKNLTYLQMTQLYIDAHKEAPWSHVINTHSGLHAYCIYKLVLQISS